MLDSSSVRLPSSGDQQDLRDTAVQPTSTNKAGARARLDLAILQVPSAAASSAHTTCSDAGNPSDWLYDSNGV